MILVLIVFFNSCSIDNDDEAIDNPTQTFLEKHEGSVWGTIDEFDETDQGYFRIINDLNMFYESWNEQVDRDCFIHAFVNLKEWWVDYDEFTYDFEISQNIEDIFQIKLETKWYGLTISVSYYTYRISYDTLEIEYNTWGETVAIYPYQRRAIDVDALKICDD